MGHDLVSPPPLQGRSMTPHHALLFAANHVDTTDELNEFRSPTYLHDSVDTATVTHIPTRQTSTFPSTNIRVVEPVRLAEYV